MNKLTYALTLPCVLTGFAALAQTSVSTSVPVVPEQVAFADISVRFDPDARRIVQQDVNALLANRQYWTAKLDRVALYFPIIEAILIDEDVPTDFKYLAVQESSLTPDAVSSSSAVGYWQFKRETANNHGLRVDDEIDERKSITASTHGAARYLKKSNGQFNNWIASLYSYYLGAGGISKLIPPDWSYAREVALDGRTDRYILRFFAHKIAVESALPTHQAGNRFALIEYGNGGGKSMQAIAGELGVDEFELRKYNRWVLGETVPTDKAYVLAVPVPGDQINDVRQKIVSVNAKKAPEFVQNDVGFPVLRRVTTGLSSKNDPVLYEINGLPGIQAQTGDNAASLARKAKISVSSFLRYNDMSEQDAVIANDVYYLAKKRKKALVPFHTVRDGETSRSISQRYGIRLKKLMRYNRLDRLQKLAVGRVMWLRERRPANKPVEIINSPTPPVYDQTPTPPTPTAEVASTDRSSAGPNRSVSGMGNVPRNASERKMYQPKLVGGGVTPNDGTTEPATRPAPTPPVPTRTTTSRSSDAGSQRVVIVRSAEADTPPKTVPVATRPQREQSAPAEATASRYEGPSEQQADGSITEISSKASTRATPPAVAKADRKPVAPVETIAAETTPAPKVVASATSSATRPSVSASTVNRSAATHTVELGQTYYSISRLYGLTVSKLLELNKLTVNDKLEAGKQLIVRETASQPAQATTSSANEGGTATIYHTVAKGETMFRISRSYNVTIEQIQEWNNLTDVVVKEGQRLKIVKSEK